MTETFLIPLIADLDFGIWNSFQLVGYNCLNVFQGFKMASYDVVFQSLEDKDYKDSSQAVKEAEEYCF